MLNPKQIVLSFEAFDCNRLPPPKSQLVGQSRLPHFEYHDLSVPFADLEDVKKVIQGCFAKPMGYSRRFKGDYLAFSLQSLSHAGCLNPDVVKILIGDLSGSTINYSGDEIVHFELMFGKFSMVAFKLLLSLEKIEADIKASSIKLEINSRFLRCFKRKRLKHGRAVHPHRLPAAKGSNRRPLSLHKRGRNFATN